MNYIFKSNIAIILLISIFVSGCGYKETTMQSRDIGFIKFIKSVMGDYKIIVNDNYEFYLKSCIPDVNTNTCQDDTINKLYEVSSGNTNIKIYDNRNQIILNKDFYIGSNNTIEVRF